MQKIDYLESKVKDMFHELSFYKSKYNEIKESLTNLSTENYLLNSDFSIRFDNVDFFENTLENVEKEIISKWYFDSKGVIVSNTFISLSPKAKFKQTLTDDYLKRLLGCDVTLSFYYNYVDTYKTNIGARIYTDDTNYTEYFKLVEEIGVNSITFNIPSNATKVECFLYNDNVTTANTNIEWAKLEKGITFTNYEKPLYSIEKAKCCCQNMEYKTTLYDMKSTDPKINLGQTKGINSAELIELFDFTFYKKIILYTSIPSDGQIIEVDLTRINSSNEYYHGSCTSFKVDGGLVYCFTRCAVLPSRKAFYLAFYKGTSKITNNSSYYCYKIEGVN